MTLFIQVTVHALQRQVWELIHLQVSTTTANQDYTRYPLQAPSDAYFTADPLWDGSGCVSTNNCCTDAGLPWFY